MKMNVVHKKEYSLFAFYPFHSTSYIQAVCLASSSSCVPFLNEHTSVFV
jgi:hypothetical protein